MEPPQRSPATRPSSAAKAPYTNDALPGSYSSESPGPWPRQTPTTPTGTKLSEQCEDARPDEKSAACKRRLTYPR